MEDTAILDLYWARDERAITETQKSYGKYCYSIAYHILHDREDTEECLNDTWMRAWNAIPPKKPNRLELFLGTITRNLSFDRWKTKNAKKRGSGLMDTTLDELAECIPAAHDTESIVEAAELERSINAFLHTLSEQECNVFLRRYWFVEEYAQIAERYGMNLNTVKTSLFRTRKKLQKYLEQQGIVLYEEEKMSEQNREKEERLFRSLSGVEEELLHRSEQNEGVEKRKANGKIRRFPLYYVSRIAAACLCFVVAGVLYMTMGGTKMADSTGADTAAPQSAYSTDAESAAPAEAFAMAQAENAAIEAEMAETAADMPEGAVAEVTAGTDGAVTGNLQAAQQSSDSMDEKQSSGMSADADSVVSVSGNEASGAEDSMEEAEQDREETLIEKQKSPSLEKMKTKGQQ